MSFFCGSKISELEKKVKVHEHSLEFLSDEIRAVIHDINKLTKDLRNKHVSTKKKYMFLHNQYNGTLEFRFWIRGTPKCEIHIFEDRKIYELTNEIVEMLEKRLYEELEHQRRYDSDLNKMLTPSFRLIEVRE